MYGKGSYCYILGTRSYVFLTVLALQFQEVKGKGKRPAKGRKVDEDEPKSKKAKKETSDEEESSEDNGGEEETDFTCSATNE